VNSSPMPSAQPVYPYYVLIPHANRPEIFLRFRDDQWYVPEWDETEPRPWQSVEHINHAVRDHFGLTATTLRCFATIADPSGQGMRRFYEMENRSAAWSPPGRDRWVRHEMLKDLPLGVPEHRAILDAWFADAARSKPSQPQPWARRGWLDSTANWIRDQFRQRGITYQSVEQVRTWEQSCLLRVHTDAGTYYFRAVPMLTPKEPQLAQKLAEWLPDRFPRVIAFDDTHQWMLLEDLGGESLENERDITRWQTAARRFAEIQIGLALRSPEFVALGCPEYALSDLPSHIAELLADDAVLTNPTSGLDSDAIALLRGRLPEFHEYCTALQRIDLPSGLDHGNLWANNILQREGGFLFMEWSGGAITHPFLSLRVLLEDAQATFPSMPDIFPRLRDAYLEPWALYRAMDDLREAFRLAQMLAPLYYATTYHQGFLARTRKRWEMEYMVPFYLKMLFA
jgi:hypothetical protein